MRLRGIDLKIGRVTLDAALGEGVTIASLTDAIRFAMASRVLPRSAEPPAVTPHSRRAAPLAGAIAAGIDDRIGAKNNGNPMETGGGGDGRR